MTTGRSDRLPDSYSRPGSASFVDFLAEAAPELLPGRGAGALAAAPPGHEVHAPHATTIVALAYPGGIVMAGDRRATMGSQIAHRHMEKVFSADEFSAVGIAGTAGLAVELVRLFQLELEHFEKIDGTLLSLDGKANRLGTMVRSNLPLALQGLAAVPLFGGFDLGSERGRIFSYDVVGGRYEEQDYHAVGSGAVFARGSLKKLWRRDLDADEAVRVGLHALVDAADDDSATGGPDLLRKIYPVVARVSESGYEAIGTQDLAAHAAAIADARAAAAQDSEEATS